MQGAFLAQKEAKKSEAEKMAENCKLFKSLEYIICFLRIYFAFSIYPSLTMCQSYKT